MYHLLLLVVYIRVGFNLIAIYVTAVERSMAILFCDVYCYIINLYMTIVMIV